MKRPALLLLPLLSCSSKEDTGGVDPLACFPICDALPDVGGDLWVYWYEADGPDAGWCVCVLQDGERVTVRVDTD